MDEYTKELEQRLAQVSANPYASQQGYNVDKNSALQAEIQRIQAERQIEDMKNKYLQQVQQAMYPPVSMATQTIRASSDLTVESLNEIVESAYGINPKKEKKEKARILERMLKSVL